MPSLRSTHVFSAVTLAACAAVFAAVVLVPAPVAVLPLAALICIGGPVVAAWQVPRAPRAGEPKMLADLRRRLDELPEVEHPLGL